MSDKLDDFEMTSTDLYTQQAELRTAADLGRKFHCPNMSVVSHRAW